MAFDMTWTKGLNINVKRKVRADLLAGLPLDKILCRYEVLERGQLKHILSYMSKEELSMREQKLDDTCFTHIVSDEDYLRGRVVKVFSDSNLAFMKFEKRLLPTMVNLSTMKTVHLDKGNKIIKCLDEELCLVS